MVRVLSSNLFKCQAKCMQVWIYLLFLLNREDECQFLWMFVELKLYLESGLCSYSYVASCFVAVKFRLYPLCSCPHGGLICVFRELQYPWKERLSCLNSLHQMRNSIFNSRGFELFSITLLDITWNIIKLDVYFLNNRKY